MRKVKTRNKLSLNVERFVSWDFILHKSADIDLHVIVGIVIQIVRIGRCVGDHVEVGRRLVCMLGYDWQ